MNHFTFKGISTIDYGILVEKKGKYSQPERDIELIHVPGRNGDLLIDHGGRKNQVVAYECAALSNSDVLDFLAALSAVSGDYQTLEDSFDEYSLEGFYPGGFEVAEEIPDKLYRFTVSFHCKPL